MPKMKTHKGAAKRFKMTANGEIKRSKGFTSHLLTSKSPKRGRNLRTSTLVSDADHAGIRKLLPYG
ncbi:MAG: 50S ribosomal protein L35 [Thermodesulfovibrionales bacterium]|nr:MAG: 50S ribosomal protein L35 [Nitrospirota bacterium]